MNNNSTSFIKCMSKMFVGLCPTYCVKFPLQKCPSLVHAELKCILRTINFYSLHYRVAIRDFRIRLFPQTSLYIAVVQVNLHTKLGLNVCCGKAYGLFLE